MRYPGAIWRPTDKHGYGNDDTCLGEGIVAHSMEGPLAAAFGELDRPDRQASWHFSIAKDGTVYQHIETENISYASGSYQANRRFWSMEHEGVAGEVLEGVQLASSTAVMGWLLDGRALVRQQTAWEHNEMTAFGAAATACPSGRIPWAEIIAALEDDMPLTGQDLDNIRQVCKEAIDSFHLASAAQVGSNLKALTAADLAAIAKAVADEQARRQKD
jgi:hypothetical protein